MNVYWENGFMILEHKDIQLLSSFEVSAPEFLKMSRMIQAIVNRAYEQGQDDKTAAIREALSIEFPDA